MSIDYRNWLVARERLAERHWHGWDGDEAANETGKRLTRFVSGIHENEIDAFMEFLNRWVSVSNQATFKLEATGADSSGLNGIYADTGEVSAGHAVFRHESGAFEFRVAVSQVTGAYYWQLIRLDDGAVLWISSGGAVTEVAATPELEADALWLATPEGVLVPRNLGDERLSLSTVAWTPNEVVHEVTPDLQVEVGWFVDVLTGAVIEPVTGSLSVSVDIPATGVQYRSVTNPQINTGNVRSGVWRQTRLQQVLDFDGRYKSKGNWVILQTLELELNTAAPIAEADTRWRVRQGRTFRGSNDFKELELPWCDPEYAEAIVKENTAETYTNAVYTLNEGLLAGTWHNINAEYEIDPQTGYATVVWRLSKQANDDVHFAGRKNDGAFAVDFYKFDAADSGLASFETDYYFDELGDWYVSADGVNYTQKNGVDATGVLPTGNGIGNIRTAVEGRVAEVQISRSETTRFYFLHAHIEFNDARDYSLVHFKDTNTTVSEVVQWQAAADVAAFAGRCYVDTGTGAVTIGDTDPGGDYVPLSESVEGRHVELDSVFDQEQGRYRIKAVVVQFQSAVLVASYLKSSRTRVIDFRLFGASRPELMAALGNYYFASDGDWFYSTDGINYTQKNGQAASGTLAAENAFNVQQADTYAARRRVSDPQIERNPAAEVYVLFVRIEYGAVVSSDNAATYATPLVTVQDVVVIGAAALPDVSSGAGYNAKGTQLVETRVTSPHYDRETDTWSYIQTTVTMWAPHADQTTGVAGYIEGPSEIRREVQSATLARGVGSGFSGLGSWAGGGRGRVRFISDGDGNGFAADAQYGTSEATKKFLPYNITIARECKIRTSARLYYYIKEPLESEYPASDAWFTKESIADKGTSDLSDAVVPQLVSIETADDTAELFGALFKDETGTGGNNYGFWLDSSTVYGKIVTYTYDDGSFTLAYYEANLYDSNPASTNGELDNIHWHRLKFTRTYPATGGGSSTGYGDGTVRVDEAGLKADPTGTLTNDDGLYMGHRDLLTDETGAEISSPFYTDSIKHRIIQVAENVYALLVEKTERTAWKHDTVNKWIMNAEGGDMRFTAPPSSPSGIRGNANNNALFLW